MGKLGGWRYRGALHSHHEFFLVLGAPCIQSNAILQRAVTLTPSEVPLHPQDFDLGRDRPHCSLITRVVLESATAFLLQDITTKIELTHGFSHPSKPISGNDHHTDIKIAFVRSVEQYGHFVDQNTFDRSISQAGNSAPVPVWPCHRNHPAERFTSQVQSTTYELDSTGFPLQLTNKIP